MGESKNIIKLKKPYAFEGTEHTEIDLSGIENLKISDAIDAQNECFSEREVAASILPETSTAFTRKLAAKATKFPIEFFKLAPLPVSKKVSQFVTGYLNVAADSEDHTMKFEKPYIFDGKTYKEVDLSGIASLTCMDESAAENRMASEGIVSADTSTNYFYACIIASTATGLPEEFFTNLPLIELLKLKVKVNSPSFFE